jgi:hypothetical protein
MLHGIVMSYPHIITWRCSLCLLIVVITQADEVSEVIKENIFSSFFFYSDMTMESTVSAKPLPESSEPFSF